MSATNFIYVTGNEGKRKRMKLLLGDDFQSKKLDLDEIQAIDPREIAEHKARQAYDIVKEPVLGEDTSLHIESLGGLPGPMIKWFLSAVGVAGICRMTSGTRTAYGVNTFAYFNGTTMHFFEGRIEGKIALKPRGSNGFGWDSIFVIDGQTKTRAELSDEENAASSGRAIALKKLAEFMHEKSN